MADVRVDESKKPQSKRKDKKKESDPVTKNPAINFRGTGGAEKTTEGMDEYFQKGMALVEAVDFKGAR